MILIEPIRLALDGIISNKMRSALTMLGLIIGVAAVILLVSIGQGVTSEITSEVQGMGANVLNVVPGNFDMGPGGGPPTYENKLTYQDAVFLEKKLDNVLGVVPLIETMVEIKYKGDIRSSRANGTSPKFPEIGNTAVSKGRFFSEAHVDGSRKVTVLGQTVVDDLFGEEEPIGERITISGQKFTVIGVMEEKGNIMGMDLDDIIYMPITTLKKTSGSDRLSSITIQAATPDDVEKVTKKIEITLAKRLSSNDFTVISQDQMLSVLQTILGTLTVMLAGIAGISLLVGGIGIMNIMLVTVTERTREIGIRKAVGAKTYDIMMQFLIESITLSFVGGAIGVLIGYLGSVLIEKVLVATEVTLWSVGLAFAFSAAVGVFFGVYPAYKAAKVDPIIALRYE